MAGAITAGRHFALVFFLIFKAPVDETMHAIEHYNDMLIR
jgi:hypothetical protein